MDNPDKSNIYIVGAGVSGLVAAIELEKYGYAPVILESDSAVGGRVQTDIVDGYQLDRGFQVLLEAYPKAQQYLDYEALQLQPLYSGALLFDDGKGRSFGDPLRDSAFLVPMLFSGDATLSDKWKSFRLNKKLQKSKTEEIFSNEEVSTLSYLKKHGFSDKVINRFYRPFFSGIYLEPNLTTSSRMFEFVFKMFGQGRAMIPKGGIGEIPKQLAAGLKQTEIRLNTFVERVTNEAIYLSNGDQLETDFTIIASNPANLLSNYASNLSWKMCDTLYFTVDKRMIARPIIGLSTAYDSLVNNVFYHTSIETERHGYEDLLSVTIVKDHSHNENELVETVQQELEKIFGIRSATFLRRYQIPNALPDVNNLQYERDPGEALLTERIAIAGDHQLNASLNAAMAAGESAAIVAHRTIANMVTTA